MEQTNEKSEAQRNPPAASPGHADKLFDLFRRITPQKVDNRFVADNNITTLPNAGQVVKLAEWLGLIDQNGNVVQAKTNKLKLIGEERNKYIAELIKEAYKDVFEKVDVQSATKNDIINYFIHNYNYGSKKAEFAGALFLHLCQNYGIILGDALKKKVIPNLEKRPLAVRTTKLAITTNRSKDDEIEPEKKGSGIEILVRGFGLETNQQNSMIARTPSELDELLKSEFEALMAYSKLLLKKVKQ